jgi:hypothetical protein
MLDGAGDMGKTPVEESEEQAFQTWPAPVAVRRRATFFPAAVQNRGNCSDRHGA